MKEKRIISDVIRSPHTANTNTGRRPLSDVLRKGDTGQSPAKELEKKPLLKKPDVKHVLPEHNVHHESSVTPNLNKSKSFIKKTAWFSVPLVAIFVIYMMISVLFSGADLKIVPKSEQVQISVGITAKKGDLKALVPFETVTLSEESSKLVAPTGTKDVSEKAGGRVVIYNAYSTASQKLIKDTRLETPDGKIYRITTGVVVPGLSVVNKETIPGSVEVTVSADKPGEQYNVGLSDFSIPGFKGDPRYEKFYARSKGEIKGGYVGSVQTASPGAVTAARNELRTAIKDSLTKQVSSQIPATFVLFKDAGNVTFETKDDVKNASGVIVKEKGTYTGILLPREALAKEVLKKSIYTLKETGPATLKDIENLTLVFQSAGLPEMLAQAESIEFSLSGTTTVEAVIDFDKVKKDISGKPRSEFNALLANYSGIKTATLSVNPFWARYLPADIEKITITQSADK
ncbi:MAG: hypothetical protein WC724_01160 [Candidatus Paceibacterota bacterium]|jgi:hypothetical protein